MAKFLFKKGQKAHNMGNYLRAGKPSFHRSCNCSWKEMVFNTISYNEPSYFINLRGYKEWILGAKVSFLLPGPTSECFMEENLSVSFHTFLEDLGAVRWARLPRCQSTGGSSRAQNFQCQNQGKITAALLILPVLKHILLQPGRNEISFWQTTKESNKFLWHSGNRPCCSLRTIAQKTRGDVADFVLEAASGVRFRRYDQTFYHTTITLLV